MKKITKEDYLRKFGERTKLMERKKRLRDSRLSKTSHGATLVVPERKPGDEAPASFLVRRGKKT